MALRFRGLDAPIEVQYWKGGKAPVPDPVTSINAQANANRYNIQGPSGSQTWSTDPSGQATQKISLNPSEQKQYDLQNQIAEQLLSGNQGHIKELTDTPFTYDTSGFDQTPYSTDKSRFASSDFSFDQSTPAAAKALYDRQVALLQPDFDRQDRSFEQRLANAGVPLGSEAYNDALSQHEQDKNFALADASRAATTMGSQLALGERQQNQSEASTLAGLGLSERQQRTNEATQKANMSLGQRQQRYNEIAGALGSSQIAPVGSYGTSGQPLDVSGAYNAQNEANLANYNAGVEKQNALLGTIGQIGAAGVGGYTNYKSNQRSTQRPSTAGGEAAAQTGSANSPSAAPASSSSSSFSPLPYTDSLDYGTQWNGMNDAQLNDALGTSGAMKAIDSGGGGINLGSIGKGIGAGMDAYGVVSGLKEGGVKGYGGALAGASNLAGLAGYGGTGTTALGAIGNAAAGNYIGAAKDAYSLYSGASGAGSGAAGGAAAGGSSLLGTIGTGAGYAGLAIAAGQAIHQAVNAHGDELRNIDASLQAGLAKPVSFNAGKVNTGYYQLSDGRLLTKPDYEKLAGAWYGANIAPDGNQAEWQQKFTELLGSLKGHSLPSGFVLQGNKVVRG